MKCAANSPVNLHGYVVEQPIPKHICKLPSGHEGRHKCRCLFEWSD